LTRLAGASHVRTPHGSGRAPAFAKNWIEAPMERASIATDSVANLKPAGHAEVATRRGTWGRKKPARPTSPAVRPELGKGKATVGSIEQRGLLHAGKTGNGSTSGPTPARLESRPNRGWRSPPEGLSPRWCKPPRSPWLHPAATPGHATPSGPRPSPGRCTAQTTPPRGGVVEMRGVAGPWLGSGDAQNVKFKPTYTERPMPGTAVPWPV